MRTFIELLHARFGLTGCWGNGLLTSNLFEDTRVERYTVSSVQSRKSRRLKVPISETKRESENEHEGRSLSWIPLISSSQQVQVMVSDCECVKRHGRGAKHRERESQHLLSKHHQIANDCLIHIRCCEFGYNDLLELVHPSQCFADRPFRFMHGSRLCYLNICGMRVMHIAVAVPIRMQLRNT